MSAQYPVDLSAMLEGIRRWVVTESPTRDRAAVNRMVDLVQSDVAGLNLAIERIPGQGGLADNLVIRNTMVGEGPGILLLSHIDTVHPMGTVNAGLPFRRDGDRLYGPGLYDMKGGAYLALEAFRQVAKAGTAKMPVTYVFTPDEEIGSPTSRKLIEDEARRARYVLVTEPARDGGKCVTARKGVGRFEVTTLGVPAHSGARHQDGRSAIKEMARQVLAIEALTDYERGVTTTVGVIRPPFEKSAAIDVLFRHAQALARGIGFELKDTEMTGGGSDGNFTAALGVPTLDGLGIDGDGAHTEWEHGLISSIEPRTRLMRGLLETLQ